MTITSFADAKARENGGEYVGGGDGAGYGSEVVDGFTYILGYEVAAYAAGEAVYYSGGTLHSTFKYLRMSCICHERIGRGVLTDSPGCVGKLLP